MLLTATLGVLGVASGALAARVAEWQVVLIPMSIVSLALAHYFAYRRGVGAPATSPALDRHTRVAHALGAALLDTLTLSLCPRGLRALVQSAAASAAPSTPAPAPATKPAPYP